MVMDEQDVPGASTGAVYRYLKGETVPSVDFLLAAAGVLGVRPAWLLLGEGEPTKMEEWYAAAAESSVAAPEQPEANAFDQVREILGPMAGEIHLRAILEVTETALRLLRYRGSDDGITPIPAEVHKANTDVITYVEAVLEHAPVKFGEMPDEWVRDNVSDFIVTACQAYKRFIPSPAEARMLRRVPVARSESD